MSLGRVQSIALVGEPVAVWTTAAVLAHVTQGQSISILVVETPDLAASPAYATLPRALQFHQRLGMDEREVLAAADGSFSLGTQLVDWNGPGHGFFQPFSAVGASIGILEFHHFAVKMHHNGDPTPFDAYSLAATAARRGAFAHPVNNPESIASTLAYGLHLNQSRYADHLKGFSQALGVRSENGNVVACQRNDTNGFLKSVSLENGETVAADFFVDCTRSGTLIESISDTAIDSWSRWFPANRTIAATAGPAGELAPFASAKGVDRGWIHTLPVSGSTVHQFFYNSDQTSDEQALAALTSLMPDARGIEPTMDAFEPGCRKEFWKANCVAMGAAAGFVEPLAVSVLHLTQQSAMRLAGLLPNLDASELLARQYNRLTRLEYENVRDFTMIHYLNSLRTEDPFWSQRHDDDLPDSLTHKLSLFESHAQISSYEEETFNTNAWAAALIGLEQWPQGYDPLLDAMDISRLQERFKNMQQIIQQAADSMPMHQLYLDRYLQSLGRPG